MAVALIIPAGAGEKLGVEYDYTALLGSATITTTENPVKATLFGTQDIAIVGNPDVSADSKKLTLTLEVNGDSKASDRWRVTQVITASDGNKISLAAEVVVV